MNENRGAQTMKSRKLSAVSLGIDSTDAGVLRIAGILHGTVVFEKTNNDASPELKRALSDGSACSAPVNLQEALMLRLNTPPLPEDKILRILPSLLDVQLPFPASECSYVFMQTPPHCIAHAVRNSDLENLISSLASLQCNPVRIVPPAVVVWAKAIEEFPPKNSEEPRAVLIANRDYTLMLTGTGQNLSGQSVFKTSPEEPPRRLRLALGTIPEGIVCICAGDEHGTTAESLAQFQKTHRAEIKSVQSPLFFLARALAADGEVNDATRYDSNLRSGTFLHPAQSRRHAAPALRFSAITVVCAAAIAAASLFSLAKANANAEASRNSIQLQINKVAGYKVDAKGSKGIKTALDAAGQNIDNAVVAFANDSIATAIPAIEPACKKHSVTLHHVFIDSAGLTASGTAPDESTIASFVREINDSRIKTALTEQPVRNEDGSYDFSVYPANK